MGWLKDMFNYGAVQARRALKQPVLAKLNVLYYEIDAAPPQQAKLKALEGIKKLIRYVEEL